MLTTNGFDSMFITRELLPMCSREWFIVKKDIMYEILKAKFVQCQPYRKLLLAYADMVFIEDTTNDYWGRGRDGNGNNHLGRLHNALASETKTFAIVGDSNARHLSEQLVHCAGVLGVMVECRTYCIPGASIKDIDVHMSNFQDFDAVFLIVGSNDIQRKDGTPKTEINTLIEQLTELKQSFKAICQNTYLIPLLPRNTGTHLQDYSTVKTYNKLAKYTNRHLPIDLSLPEFWKRDKVNTDFLLADGVHLNIDARDLLCTKMLNIFLGM